MKRIFVDSGHHLGDGAIGRVAGKDVTLIEESLNWEIATKVEATLESAGHLVMLSRTRQESPNLKKRAEKASQWNADIAFSIHHNIGEPQYAKTEVYVVKEDPIFSQGTHRCDLYTVFGDAYVFNLEPRTEKGFWKDRARHVVYPYTPHGIPCALIECGYLNAPSHQKLMIQPIYTTAMARAISDYVIACVGRLPQEVIKVATTPTEAATPTA